MFAPSKGRRGRPATLLLLASLLSACASSDEPAGPCPVVSVLADAETVTRFRPGPGRDLVDVQYQAELANARLSCSYDENVLTVGLAVDLVAQRGPAADANSANFPFFVAVTGPDQQILGKRVFDSEVAFPKSRRRAGVREEIEQVVPLAPGQDGGDLEVLVGFQLSRDELAYNRERKGR